MGICSSLTTLAQNESHDIAYERAERWFVHLEEMAEVAVDEPQRSAVGTLMVAVKFWLNSNTPEQLAVAELRSWLKGYQTQGSEIMLPMDYIDSRGYSEGSMVWDKAQEMLLEAFQRQDPDWRDNSQGYHDEQEIVVRAALEVIS